MKTSPFLKTRRANENVRVRRKIVPDNINPILMLRGFLVSFRSKKHHCMYVEELF